MKKRIVALLLVLCVTAGLFGGMAFAQEGTADGAYGFVGVLLDWNTGEILNRDTYFQQALHRWPGVGYALQFAYQEGDVITPITPTRVELTMTNGTSSAIRLESLNTTDACPVYQVHFVGLGEGYLTVTLGENESFQIPVSSALPELGFYSRECSTEAELGAAYLSNVTWDGSQEAITVYALFKDQPQSVQLDSFTPDEGIVATCTPLASKRGFQIDITGCSNRGNIRLNVTATFANGSTMSMQEWLYVYNWIAPDPGPGAANAGFYASKDKVGGPLTSLPIGNALEDRTFYVFPDEGFHFDEQTELYPNNSEYVTVNKITNEPDIYFELVFSTDAVVYQNFGCSITGQGTLDIPLSKPKNYRHAEIQVNGETYLVGLVREISAGNFELAENGGGLIEEGRDTFIYSGTLGAVKQEFFENTEVLTPVDEISSLLKIQSAGMYSYVNGQLQAVDGTDPNVEPLSFNGRNIQAGTKLTATPCAYYVVVTFTVGDDPTVHTFYSRFRLQTTRTNFISLTEAVTLDELNAKIAEIDRDGYSSAVIDMAFGNDGQPLVGTLVINCETPLQINTKGTILKGSVRVDSAPGRDSHVIRHLQCISPTQDKSDPTNVGVNGVGRVSMDRCSFTGYHTGVHVYEVNDAYDNGDVMDSNASYQKDVFGCLFLNCGTGISVQQQGWRGSSRNTIQNCLFSGNGVAANIISLNQQDNVVRQLNFENCAFLGNGSDVINNSGFTLKMYRCYFGLELTGGGLQLEAPRVDGRSGVITAPQVRRITLGDVTNLLDTVFSLDVNDLLAMGSQADVDNDDNSAFDVSGLEGLIKVWQGEGSDYRHIASWSILKSQPRQSRIMASVVQAEPETVDFNPQVAFGANEKGFLTVHVQSSPALKAYAPSLTVDCDYGEAQVMYNGQIVPSTLDTEAKMLTFQVSEGGLYTVQPYQELYSMPAFGDGTVTVPVNLAALGSNAPASDSVQVLCAFYTAAGQMVDCQTADMIQDCENLTFQTEADYDKIQVSILDKTTWKPLVGKAPFQRPPENG